MPLKSVYIRQEDLELWKNLKDKSEAVHNMLHSSHVEAPRMRLNEKDESRVVDGVCSEHGCPLVYCAGMIHKLSPARK